MAKIGDWATYCIGSDRYPYEVIEVSKSGHKIVLHELNATVISGSCHDGSAHYEYSKNPEGYGSILVATRRKDGTYRAVGCRNYGAVHIGIARMYRDPSF